MNIFKTNVWDVLFTGKRKFHIPIYQRHYVWSTRQCQKLFDDIQTIIDSKDKEHYLGSWIFQTHKSQDATCYVIDGQQRIVSLSLLFLALTEKDPDLRVYLKGFSIRSALNKNDYEKLKEIVPVDPFEVLQDLVNGKTIENDHKKETVIYKNYCFFKELVSQQESSLDYCEAFKRLVVAEILIEPSDDAQALFESINTTGKPLTLVDKIRNYVLMNVTSDKMEDCYFDKWLPMEKLLGNDFESFLKDFTIFKHGRYTKSWDDYKKFQEVVQKLNQFNGYKSTDPILDRMVLYAPIYYGFIHCRFDRFTNDYPKKISNRLRRVDYRIRTGFDILKAVQRSNIYLFLLFVFRDYAFDEKITKETLRKVVTLIAHYKIRRSIQADTHDKNWCVKLYQNIFLQKVKKRDQNKSAPQYEEIHELISHYYDAIYSYLKDKEEDLFSDQKFEEALWSVPLFYTPVCKYLLFNYSTQKPDGIPAYRKLTIEHILPQNKRPDDSWVLAFDKRNFLRNQKKYVNRLGNLTLLTQSSNSSCSDNSLMDKKKVYVERAKYFPELFTDIMNKDVWNIDNLMARGKNLAHNIVKQYSLPEPNQDKFDSYEFFYVKCDFDEKKPQSSINPTGRKPIACDIDGRRIRANRFTLMYRKVVARLYKKYPQRIYELAQKKKQFLSLEMRDKKDNFELPIENGKTIILLGRNQSARWSLSKISLLLQALGLESNFTYYVEKEDDV